MNIWTQARQIARNRARGSRELIEEHYRLVTERERLLARRDRVPPALHVPPAPRPPKRSQRPSQPGYVPKWAKPEEK